MTTAKLTKRDRLDAMVLRLNQRLGLPIEPWFQNVTGGNRANIGNIHLDSAYGGLKLEQMMNDAGGVRTVGSDLRHTPKEMAMVLRAMLDALDLKEVS